MAPRRRPLIWPAAVAAWVPCFGGVLWAIDRRWADCSSGGRLFELWPGEMDIVCAGAWLALAAFVATAMAWAIGRLAGLESFPDMKRDFPSLVALALSVATAAVLVTPPVLESWERTQLRSGNNAAVAEYADTLAAWWANQVEDVTGERPLEPGFVPSEEPGFVAPCVLSLHTWIATGSGQRAVAAVWMQNRRGAIPISGCTSARLVSGSELWSFAEQRFEVAALVDTMKEEDRIMVFAAAPPDATPLATEPELQQLAKIMLDAHQPFTSLLRCVDQVPDVIVPTNGAAPYLQCPESVEPIPWRWR